MKIILRHKTSKIHTFLSRLNVIYQSIISVLFLDGQASIETFVTMEAEGTLNLHEEVEATIEHLKLSKFYHILPKRVLTARLLFASLILSAHDE